MHLSIDIENNVLTDYFVPPASIQVMLENAVKHNKFTSENPLNIKITSQNGCIIVENNLNKRKSSDSSTKKGLSNLKKRYDLLCDKQVLIHESANFFTIQIPLIEKSHESFNS